MGDTRAEVLTFLRAKLADAEQSISARESMAEAEEIQLPPDEWKAAMALHPSTRGTPMPTDAQRAEAAARQRRIANKYRHDVAMYRAAIALLEEVHDG